MKQFLKQIIFYSSLLIVILIGFEIITSNILISNSDFKITSNPKYIIVGNSHAEMAYNDSLISDVKNLSESGEAYFYTYYKVEKILKHNSSISTVFIEFTNVNIDKKMDSWTWDDVFMTYRLEKYAPLIEWQGKAFLLYKNPFSYITSLIFICKERIKLILDENLVYDKKLGGYKKFDKADEVNANKKSDIDILTEQLKDYDVSNQNLKYLHKIVKLCNDQEVNIVFIRSPQHSDYGLWGNEPVFQNILKQQFAGLDFLDFSRFNLEDDDYLNAAHLNAKGAKRFSIWFDKMLKTELLNPKNRSELNRAIIQVNY